LLVFGPVVDERAAVGMDHIAEKPVNGDFSRRRVLVQVADHLSAQDPEVVHMLTNGLRGKTR
jgi:hypothetical protein